MAQHGTNAHYAQSPVVAALKYESGAGPEPHKVLMERSFSQDIQEGTQELKKAAEQTRNIILDLGLDGVIRWVSPSWTDVVGTRLEAVKGKPIADFISDNPKVFDDAMASLKANDSKSQFVKFAIETTAKEAAVMLDLQDVVLSPGEERPLDQKEEKKHLELEGQGIMVYDRVTGGESHTMWMLQPATLPVQVTIALPQSLVEKLGVGAEILAKHLTELAEFGVNDPANHPPPLPVVCRVCERSINPWWFERHSDLCVQEHKAELDIQMIQESLAEHRNAIVKVLDAFEARSGRPAKAEGSPTPAPEYKGQPIGPSPSSSISSAFASPNPSPVRSRSPSAQRGHGHSRVRSSFLVRRPLVRIVELILDLCDTAMEINVPSIKEVDSVGSDGFRTQSPQSESRVAQVLNYQQPSSLENEPGLAALTVDTEKLARAKVEAVHRHQVILEYSERIRQEYMAEVDDCIAEALEKAERAVAGDPLSSSSESESESESEGEEFPNDLEGVTPLAEVPTPHMSLETALQAHEAEMSRRPSRPPIRSMASALRNPHDIPPVTLEERRDSGSQAVSTGSNSPIECPTPRSHKSTLLQQPQPISNRRSIYADDVDSDGSLQSSSVLSAPGRPESPASNSDAGLSRTVSSRDRDRRKRRSIHMHGLGSASPHRQQSPGRYPQAPTSPLRMTKSRLPSVDIGPSPVVSPLLTSHEYGAPSPTLHHRRQSSIHSSDLRTPLSPRLPSLAQPQAKAQPPSIKDFEIIKPISKGAFGSVYLAKKKLTGEYFAIKVLRKSDMVAKNQVTNVKAERAIMMWQGESEFVAKLYWTFSSKEHLFLVMEYLNGGDCASLVKILGGLSEDWAKKYIAEVVLGVAHLHSRGIVHRDLKPDNLLIDSKGHLKLTDFGLSRMGLIGRQQRALKSPDEGAPDLLKQGPFASVSGPPSRSASFDYQGTTGSPAETPLMTPALAGSLDQPSYFSLSREASLPRGLSRRPSGYRAEGGTLNNDLHSAFQSMSLSDSGEIKPPPTHLKHSSIEEETASHGSASPDLFPLAHSMSHSSTTASQMLPPPTALFDPEESNKRFVGTPDYLAPETITGTVQDEMCDWWSLGCILFEFLFGYPPFNADTTDQVFDNILHRRIAWPDDEDVTCSDDAKDLINELIKLDPQRRLGANLDEKYPCGSAEIQAHPWFADINWTSLLEDEAQFVPNPENPEDTEYFDTRGATLQAFPEESEDVLSPGSAQPIPADYHDRPHDALFRARTQTLATKRGLMPLHIPPHVARDSRTRRLSEPVIADDFGNFTFKNLPVLEKANKDIVEKMRKEAMQAQARGYSHSQAVSIANTPVASSPAPSLEGGPLLPMPVKRALSVSKGHRPASPSGFGPPINSSPSRPSQPSSPLLVQFSTLPYHHHHQHHERRKTSGSSASSSAAAPPPPLLDLSRDIMGKDYSAASSPVTHGKLASASPAKPSNPALEPTSATASSPGGRNRSQTVGSHASTESSGLREPFVPGHHKRRSQLLAARDVSPSSSDNENVSQAKALMKVQRKRQSSRRMSQINLLNGPAYRPLDVLVCEDHPVSRMVMERLLEKLRCRCITATSGPDVLRMAYSQLQFDVIFMEFKLPLINGVDVARMIRDTKSANTNTPIVCITGYLKDLPEVNYFDNLMLKPPTIEKLTESLCKYCLWKPPPKDLKFTAPLTIPGSALRSDSGAVQDSPSSVASSRAPTMPDSSWRGSSREDSIGSGGFFSDLESFKNDEIPVIVSRTATDDWSKDGLGISHELANNQRPHSHPIVPHLLHTESAPASTVTADSASITDTAPTQDHPPKQRRSRENLEARSSAAGAEEGDDEDEELGSIQSRSKSPASKIFRPMSKLGHEMLRTNSRGSVISIEEQAEPGELRKSLELLEERMQAMQIPEEVSTLPQPTPGQPRKIDRDVSVTLQPALELQIPATGHITPPVLLPRNPGEQISSTSEPETEITPIPNRTLDIEEQTPRPHSRERPLL